ncbi:MAG: choice-of-anchor N protein [Candidatus Omnitrophica bacterium]|nr:choice-of-anchor N protein [Candidatus Omnitrophota bacterium]
MKKLFLTLVCLFFVAGSAWATPPDNNGGKAKIWLSIPGAEEVGISSDPWLEESDLTHNPSFTLNFQNTADATIFDAHLVLSIPGTSSPTEPWKLTVNTTPYYYSSFTNTGSHTYLPPHSIFWPEGTAKWTEYTIGDVAAGTTIGIPVSITDFINSGLKFHFDAYGSSDENNQNGWYFNPPSHDANVVTTPEPISSALFLLGSGALAVGSRIKRKKA